MDTFAIQQMAEDIAGQIRHQVGTRPAHVAVKVSNSRAGGKHLASVSVCDQGGYPLFAINVDLQGMSSASLALHNALGKSVSFGLMSA